MATAYDQSRERTVFMLTTSPGEVYSFHYGHDPIDLMCGLTRRSDEGDAKLIGSAVPLIPIEVGKSALLGVDTQFKDRYILEVPEICYIGPAPDELQPSF